MRSAGITLLLVCSLVTAVVVAQTQKESAAPAAKIKTGDLAPDFTLVDQNGQPHSLHDYRGRKNVALAFYVFAFGPN